MPNSEEIYKLIMDNISIYETAYDLALNGKTKFENPYLANTTENSVWYIGTQDGKSDRELEFLPSQKCFILGMEYASVATRIELKVHIVKTIHSQNLGRIKKLCKLYNRNLKYKVLNDDWASIEIQPE